MTRYALAAALLLLAPAVATAEVAQSRVIFLNRQGVTVVPGSSDARVNRSSVASQMTTIPAWNPPDQVWADTVTCLEDMFAPFAVEFTETDPGMTPHIEAVFGGTPNLLGQGPRVGGAAPLSSTCAVIENAMVFAFTGILIENGQVVCETMSQEIAHAYGLDHEMLAGDPMSYLRHDGKRSFQNTMASCGETTARPCGIGATSCRAEQNSYALLIERLGASGYVPEPVTPPKADEPSDVPVDVGCSTSGGGTGLVFGLLLIAAASVRGKRRHRASARSAAR